MTVIAGWHDKERAWIGGDSGAFDEDSVSLTETKVWKADGFLLGACGGFRLAEIAYDSGIGEPYRLRDHLEMWWKDLGSGENDTTFLCLNTLGIWIIGSDFSVIRCRENYAAIGGGGLSAMSALRALQDVSMGGKDRITTSLKTSAYHTSKVRTPFRVISL